MYSENEDDSEGPEQEMHKAICASCGKECEVPFKPSEDRPVYCRDCFSKRRNNRRFERNDRRPRRMYQATCASCGKKCEVPFEPKDDRPVYCRDCFSKRRESED